MTREKTNQEKLDNCEEPHDFQPIFDDECVANRCHRFTSASFYVCSKCGGRVGALEGLRYTLAGDFGEEK